MKIDKYSAILGNTVGFHDMSILTDHRPVASLPFGGKYRLIDFPLSALLMQVFVVSLVFSSRIISAQSLTIFVQGASGAYQPFLAITI